MAGPQVTTTGLRSSTQAAATLSDIQWAAGAGSADVITAAMTPALTALTDGVAVAVRVAATNATTTPTLNVDGLGAHTIVKNYSEALEPGDIPAEGIYRFKEATGVWELINPATQWREVTEWAIGGGTVDAITATFSPLHGTLHDGQEFAVRAAGANTLAAPTFSPDTTTARIIYKLGKQALAPGDIYGANHEIKLKYHVDTVPWFELLNPAAGPSTSLYFKLLSADAATFADDALAHAITGFGVTLPAGTYAFRGRLHTTRALGSGSHTTSLLWGGTAVVTTINGEYRARTGDAKASAALNVVGFDVATAIVVKAASTSTTEDFDAEVEGIVVIGTAGTLLLEMQYSGAPGGVTTPKAGSWLELQVRANPQGTWA